MIVCDKGQRHKIQVSVCDVLVRCMNAANHLYRRLMILQFDSLLFTKTFSNFIPHVDIRVNNCQERTIGNSISEFDLTYLSRQNK